MGLVVLVGAPWLSAGEVVIVGGVYVEKEGRDAYALLKCIYFLLFVLILSLQCLPLLVTFIHASFFLGSPHCHFVFSESLPESSDLLSSR